MCMTAWTVRLATSAAHSSSIRHSKVKLRLNEWTTGEGERRSKLQVVADDVAFLDKPKTADGNGSPREEIPDRPAVGAYRRKAG
jgi:single-stranded DNA-binding protein